ncbi:hypothetical protein [Nocardia sp. NPDC050406]|uniref:hypothetical protein n=1 Tax=Nocardia sp. NPDC050406 TaxID=3364318 RepID=UPI00379583CF
MKFTGALSISLMLGAAAVTGTGSAAAAPTTIPFQINPAPFGNPNGSFDVRPAHCGVRVGERPGVAVVTGSDAGGWGCWLATPVHWVNVSTGASGAARLSDGLNGIPSFANLETGPGQVMILLVPGGTSTPGFTSVLVP